MICEGTDIELKNKKKMFIQTYASLDLVSASYDEFCILGIFIRFIFIHRKCSK